MTYNTPNLFLVGSAQSLVLVGHATSQIEGDVCLRSDEPFTSDVSEDW